MREGSKRVSVGCTISPSGDRVEFFLVAIDGAKLTPQNIIDALGDYLITDPAELFKDN